MPILHLENLATYGLIRDLPSHALPPEAWSEGRNIRFHDGQVQKFLGSQEISPTWGGILTSLPLTLFPWIDIGGSYWLFCTAEQIGLLNTSSTLDVTSVAGTYGGNATSLWSGGILGGVPILNIDSGVDLPQSWDSSTSLFVDLPGWPAATYAKRLGIFKQWLVALDITAAGNRNPHMIKWSSQAYPGSVPQYWDNADSNDSNESHLPEGGGFLIDQQVLGQWNILYKEELTYIMSYVGPPFIFAFTKARFDSGILAPRCAQVIDKGRHCVITKDDIIVHDGQQSESIVNKKWRTWFFKNISPTKIRQTFMVVNSSYSEVWICFVSNSVNGNYADTALVWNYKDNTWGIRDLEQITHIALGVLDTTVNPVIDNVLTIINTDTSLIDGVAFGINTKRLIGVSEVVINKQPVEFDITNRERGRNMVCYVQRTGLAIVGKDHAGNLTVDQSYDKLWKRIWPKVESTSTLDFNLGYQKVLNGAVTWSKTYSFDPSVDQYFDPNIQGKLIAIKVSSSIDVEWKLSGLVVSMETLNVTI